MSILSIILFGIGLGAVFGVVEGAVRNDRIERKDRRKLPHTALLAVRLVVCWVITLLATSGNLKTTAIIALALFIVLTIVHRMVFNTTGSQPFWYMGPPVRTKGDSLYDTILWMVPIYTWDFLCKITGRSFGTFPPYIPFILATLLEGTALFFTIRHLP